jgi:hypothetical protein
MGRGFGRVVERKLVLESPKKDAASQFTAFL